MADREILLPVAALVAWSLLMMFWMVATRLPALRAKGISFRNAVGGRPGMLDGMVDERAQWKAHNYIHLMEQPTLFYAIALTLAVTGQGHGLNAQLAWAYVALRVVHSLVQALVNRILYRFIVFTLASVVLVALTVHALIALIH